MGTASPALKRAQRSIGVAYIPQGHPSPGKMGRLGLVGRRNVGAGHLLGNRDIFSISVIFTPLLFIISLSLFSALSISLFLLLPVP